MAKGLGQGERAKGPPILSLLLSSTFVFLRSPFRATVHYPLSTIHCPLRLEQASSQWAREFFFQCRCKGSIDVHLGASDIFKSSYSRCNYSGFSISTTPLFFLFSVLLQRKGFGDLFLMMVFHRRSKRVKMFFTMYLYKRDSNTSKRTCILIHNYLKEKTRKKKKCSNQLILVIPLLNLTYLCLLTDASINKTQHCTSLKFVFVGFGRRRLADVAQKADFWAILHYILYPKKMTLLNKISVLKDEIQIVCWNLASDQR